MRYQGKIKQWDDEKGYGFILPNDGSRQVFLHIKSFTRRHAPTRKGAGNQRRLIPGDLVTYVLGKDAQGRPFANEVRLVGEEVRAENGSGWALTGTLLLAFGLFLAYASFSGALSTLMVKYYLAASLLTFVVYALDKSAAKRAAWRTQESTLHLLALAGGWPGALLAQQLLRHKSSKPSFRRIFWLTLCINLAIVAWLIMTPGH